MIKNHILYNNYSDWTFDVSGAKGSYIYSRDGKELIDFTSGWNVTNLGWNNPEIAEAASEQIRRNTYAPMWTADEIQNLLAFKLTRSLPKMLNTVGRATGGTEANEEALKTARAYTGRKKIIGFKDTYHGQSFGTMSIGYIPEYVKMISPMVGGFIQVDFPKLYGSQKSDKEILKDFSENLEVLLKKEDVAAVITEAGIITGWGSTHVAPHGFLKLVRDLTKKYGTMLILDEVGTGFSRLGRLYGMEIEGITPDIVTFAKGFCNGVAPLGAMVTNETIAEKTFKLSNITSTFGWMPVACAAALKTLEIHQREKIWQKAQQDGDYFINTLRNELRDLPVVEDIRGIGMEVGVQLANEIDMPPRVDTAVTLARKSGLHIVSDHVNNIQLMPPLTIKRKTLDVGLGIFAKTIKSLIR